MLALKPFCACSTSTFLPDGSAAEYSVIGASFVVTRLVITGPLTPTFQPGFTPYSWKVTFLPSAVPFTSTQLPVVFLKRKSFSGGAMVASRPCRPLGGRPYVPIQ